MSFDKLIYAQVQEALQPVLSQLNQYIDKFSKAESYQDIQVPTSEVARMLNRTPVMIHNYVENGLLKPVNLEEKHKKFTIAEVERFKRERMLRTNGGLSHENNR